MLLENALTILGYLRDRFERHILGLEPLLLLRLAHPLAPAIQDPAGETARPLEHPGKKPKSSPSVNP